MKSTALYHRLSSAVSLVAAALLVTIVGGAPAHANARFWWTLGVAVDRQGNIFVADTSNTRVVELSPAGRVLRAWHAACSRAAAGRPQGVAVDRRGNVYVTDPYHNCVLKYSSRGRLLGQFGTTGDGEVMAPLGVAVGGGGNIFVADTGKHSIDKLSPSGYVLARWETRSSDSSDAVQPGVPPVPSDIAVDALGNIYTVVGLPGWWAVQKRGPDGKLLAEWTELGWLSGLAVGGRGNVFAGNWVNGHIIKLSPDGQRLADWHARHLRNPSAIAVDRRGDLYVANEYDSVIVKVSSTGRELAVWDGSGR